MNLHQHEADGLVAVAADEDEQNRRAQPDARKIDGGQHHQIHEDDFQNRAIDRVARGAVGVVLRPVAHADDGDGAIDQEDLGADVKGFAGEPQRV